MIGNVCLVVDVWEDQGSIDIPVLKANGVSGIMIRLNDMQGGHHMDSNFTKQWLASEQLIRVPYFVYNPWSDGEINFMWLKSNMPPSVKVIAIDVEVRYMGYSPNLYAAELLRFLSLCEGYGLKTIIYTGQGSLDILSSWPKSADYWWAQYPSPAYYFPTVKTWDDLRVALRNLSSPFNQSAIPGHMVMWQFSGDYLVLPGVGKKLDVNVFYGNETDLANYFQQGVSSPSSPPPAITGDTKIVSVTLAGTKIPAIVRVVYTEGGVNKFVDLDQSLPVVNPTPVPTPEFPHLYRIKDDREAGVPQRDHIRNSTWSTVRLHGNTSTLRLSPAWMKYVYDIQPNPNYQFEGDKVHLKFKPDVGWHNHNNADKSNTDVVEKLTCSGNIVDVTRIEGRKAYIRCAYNNEAPPDTLVIPRPDKLHPVIHLGSIQYLNRLDMTCDEKYPLILVIAEDRSEELWIDIGDIVRL